MNVLLMRSSLGISAVEHICATKTSVFVRTSPDAEVNGSSVLHAG